jgi:hypothetical protein
MSDKTTKIIFWVSTGLLALMFVGGAMGSFFDYENTLKEFTALGFPSFIIYPLAILKVLGAIAILSRLSSVLQYLAYAGIFYDILLAFGAHLSISDGEAFGTLIPLALCIVSFFFARKMEKLA